MCVDQANVAMIVVITPDCRVIPDRWKGMSPKQVHEVRTTQEQQKAEKKVHNVHKVWLIRTFYVWVFSIYGSF